MKQYPSPGDSGKGTLGNGSVETKDSAVFEAVGSLDELSSHLGWCATAANAELKRRLEQIQRSLFVVGAHLGRTDGPGLDPAAVQQMEKEIHELWAELPPLRGFILPGQTELAGRLHIARTVCRRAERAIVRYLGPERLPCELHRFLNRLGDWLYVQGRWANHQAGLSDHVWHDGR